MLHIIKDMMSQYFGCNSGRAGCQSSPELLGPAQVSLENGGFSLEMRLQRKCTSRESPESDYFEGNNTTAYPFCAVLQAFSGIIRE